jgi:hypothetical protein
MTQCRSLCQDARGAGSFLEAMLAMMVICCAFGLLAAHLPQLISASGPGGLERDAEALQDQALTALVDAEGVVRHIHLLEIDLEQMHLRSAIGCRIDILPVCCQGETMATQTVLSWGILPERLEMCLVLSVPISLEVGGGKVMAAEMLVMVW